MWHPCRTLCRAHLLGPFPSGHDASRRTLVFACVLEPPRQGQPDCSFTGAGWKGARRAPSRRRRTARQEPAAPGHRRPLRSSVAAVEHPVPRQQGLRNFGGASTCAARLLLWSQPRIRSEQETVAAVHDPSGRASSTPGTGLCLRLLHGRGHTMPAGHSKPPRGLVAAPCAVPRRESQTDPQVPARLSASAGPRNGSRHVLLAVAVPGSPLRPGRSVLCTHRASAFRRSLAGAGLLRFVAVGSVSRMLPSQKMLNCCALRLQSDCLVALARARLCLWQAMASWISMVARRCTWFRLKHSHLRPLGLSGPAYTPPLCSSWRPRLRSPSARSP